MKRSPVSLLCAGAFLMGMLLPSCVGTQVEPVEKDPPVTPYVPPTQQQVTKLDLSGASAPFASDPSSFNVSVTCDGEWKAVLKGGSWLHITKGASGKGNETISLSLDENTDNTLRSDVLTVTAGSLVKELTITQNGQTDVFNVKQKYWWMESPGGEISVAAETNVEYTVSVPEGVDWIKEVFTKAMRSVTTVLQVAENTGMGYREAQIKLVSREITHDILIRQGPGHPFLKESVPGIYGQEGPDYLYQAGRDQLSSAFISGAGRFRILNPVDLYVVQVNKIPAEIEIGALYPIDLSVFTQAGTAMDSTVDACAVRLDGDQVWFSLSDGTALIVIR